MMNSNCRAIVFLRSFLLIIALLTLTVPYSFLALLTFPFSMHTRYRIITAWTHVALWLVEHLVGIRYRVEGRENLPSQPSVILSKHQSAWETLAFQVIFPPQVYVLKKELFYIPFFGWGLAMLPMISINRGNGREALRQILQQGQTRLKENFWVITYPEGTRVAPGTQGTYQSGGAFLAVNAGVPVVPVALDSGKFWPRNSFLKYPGTITVKIGPAIDTQGLSSREVTERARAWIEST